MFDTTIQVKLVSSIDEAPLSSLDLRYQVGCTVNATINSSSLFGRFDELVFEKALDCEYRMFAKT